MQRLCVIIVGRTLSIAETSVAPVLRIFLPGQQAIALPWLSFSQENLLVRAHQKWLKILVFNCLNENATELKYGKKSFS